MGVLTLSDAELVRRAKAGDLAAFEELVNRYERRNNTPSPPGDL